MAADQIYTEMYPPEVGPKPFYSWAPWILSFVLANGFFEESMARRLFLKKFEPLLGAFFSNLFTAPVLAIGHAGVTYSGDVLVFVAITFVLALIWGYLMQKTDSL